MSEPIETTPKQRQKADQDRIIAEFNTASAQYLDTIDDTPEIADALRGRGYDRTRLTDGRTRQQHLQATITTRQTLLSQQGNAGSGLIDAGDGAYIGFKDYRETVKAIAAFTASDRTALLAGRTISRDRQQFITQATTAYENAGKPPYAAVLAEFGYPADALATALNTLAAYSKADTDQNSVAGDATKATADRNAAYTDLKTYMKQLKGIARVALRTRPDLLKKLEG